MPLLDLPGPTFLVTYLVIVLAVGVVLPRVLRSLLRYPGGAPARRELDALHPYEAVYLIGGGDAVFNAALAALVHRRYIAVNTEDHTLVYALVEHEPEHEIMGAGVYRGTVLRKGEHPLEREILAHLRTSGRVGYRALRAHVERAIEQQAWGLSARGLLLSREAQSQRSLLIRVLPWLVVALGAAKMFVGVSHDRQVFFLGILVALAVWCAWRIPPIARLTKRGERAGKRLLDENAALEVTLATAPAQLTADEVALACGLFGGTSMAGGLDSLAMVIEAQSLATAIAASSGGGGGGGSSWGTWGSSCGSSCGGCGGGGGCGGCGGS